MLQRRGESYLAEPNGLHPQEAEPQLAADASPARGCQGTDRRRGRILLQEPGPASQAR